MQTTTHEKESAICEAPQTADKDTSQQTKATSPAIVAQHRPSDKQFSTAQAQAARAGFELTTSHHDETGLTLWQVARWGQSRQFSEWSEVCQFVAQIGGGGRHA
jgi:hypothetical protein